MTRTCPDCGGALEPGELFCGECGAYVAWTEDAPQGAAEGAAAPQPVPAAAPADPPPSSAPPLGPPHGPPPGPPPAPPPPSAPPPPGPPGADWQPPAQALVVPVDRPAVQPTAQQPAARQPGAAAPRAKRPPAPDDVPIRHGDLVCGDCGAGNQPARKFCRRCGRTLAEAEVARVAWWRRLLQRRRRSHDAGSRPRAQRRVGFPGRGLVLVAVLAALVASVLLLRGPIGGAYEAVRDRISGVEKVNPRLSASSSLPGHAARLARDGTTNRYWAPEQEQGAWLAATFRSPVRLVYVVVTPGASGESEEAFLQQGRPSRLRVEVTRSGGSREVEVVDLEDSPGPVEISVGTSDVTRVTLHVVASEAGSAPDSHTAIAEIECYVRQ
jgi:hypothetical protein